MRIPLRRECGIPLYRQIETHLRQAIGSGSIGAGARLPSTRNLAADLGVNRLTVETAYAELRSAGLIASRAGSGSYVRPSLQLVPQAEDAATGWPAWQKQLPEREWMPGTAAIGTALNVAGPSLPIDLAGDVGDALLFPMTEFRRAMQATLRRDGAAAMDYGDPAGYPPLRRAIADLLVSRGLYASPGSILVTTGAQQAISVAARLLTSPGDTVFVEQPTYPGALGLFRALGLRIVALPMDDRGVQTDGLPALLEEHRPKLLYTMAAFHNPTGATLAGPRRAALVAAAGRYGVPVIEDDYAGDLRYEGRAQPPLKALDPGGLVIYAGTFSPSLMPGLRAGFLVAEGPVFGRLAGLKQVLDLAGVSHVQRALAAYLTSGRYGQHLSRIRSAYRLRRDSLLTVISEQLPATVRVAAPQGGLFLWLRLPAGVSASQLLPLAGAEGVVFMPGPACFADAADGERFARLNFACQPEAEGAEGIARLARALKRYGQG